MLPPSAGRPNSPRWTPRRLPAHFDVHGTSIFKAVEEALTCGLEASRESRGDVTAMENGQSGSDALAETSADDSAGQPNMDALAGANDDSGAAFTTGNALPTTASRPPPTCRACRDLAEAPGRIGATTTVVQHQRWIWRWRL